jgi:hypothetical protein
MNPERFDRLLLVHGLLREMHSLYSSGGVSHGRSLRSIVRDLLQGLLVWHHQIDWMHPQVAELEFMDRWDLISLAEDYPRRGSFVQTSLQLESGLGLIDNHQLAVELAIHLEALNQIEDWMIGRPEQLLARQVRRLLVAQQTTPRWPLSATVYEARERGHVITRKQLDDHFAALMKQTIEHPDD